jgi:hypothetical protein
MTTTDILLALVFCGTVADFWITRKWLAHSRRVMDELMRQSAAIAGANMMKKRDDKNDADPR